MTREPFFTIGYEGTTPSAFAAALENAGVDLLVDVRAVAASRRPGFSKGALSASVNSQGIGYVHLRALGTPKEGREAARSGDAAGLTRIYGAHLQTDPAKAALQELKDLASGRRICLLCFERHVEGCHRLLIADWLCEQIDAEPTHLMPAPF
ncbi:DUF488 family protein [Xanthobacter tagetidis]|uniref:DUF488 domain-containing protein n=1 Tax=Xanthobacter tagetidis TaxID=60216 RepID=A0A3L7AN94_9HYPH|nr:DUF488 domain-containing protein [Xanthobacter tagetidis]MBB6307515.1 uncharacterized protein (DUF488 family) [Xanthobacter tagetidis]RLP81091.1 DUF488 domain-containing protein [Xanthobacter tagetidis]